MKLIFYFNWQVIKKQGDNFSYKIVYDCSNDHVWIDYTYKTWISGSDYSEIFQNIENYGTESCWARQEDKHVTFKNENNRAYKKITLKS